MAQLKITVLEYAAQLEQRAASNGEVAANWRKGTKKYPEKAQEYEVNAERAEERATILTEVAARLRGMVQ